LEGEQFGFLQDQTGTLILAPGFSIRFGGDFSTVNGVIAASGIEFQGNAGGVINGSVINYSDACMTLDGNTDLIFNRSGTKKNPAGFEPQLNLQLASGGYYEPSS
jgi:hypothetical protein